MKKKLIVISMDAMVYEDLQELKDRQIPIEICITSNTFTKAVVKEAKELVELDFDDEVVYSDEEVEAIEKFNKIANIKED